MKNEEEVNRLLLFFIKHKQKRQNTSLNSVHIYYNPI